MHLLELFIHRRQPGESFELNPAITKEKERLQLSHATALKALSDVVGFTAKTMATFYASSPSVFSVADYEGRVFRLAVERMSNEEQLYFWFATGKIRHNHPDVFLTQPKAFSEQGFTKQIHLKTAIVNLEHIRIPENRPYFPAANAVDVLLGDADIDEWAGGLRPVKLDIFRSGKIAHRQDEIVF